ncbi:MAG: 3'-5' exonuclease [Bacteroidetes bacterium]|nr:MAG: 3'-5' exonuclease [Bacteroidota bacterium]
MLDKIKIKDVLFLDIETVSAFPAHSEMSERLQELWAKKTKYIQEKEDIKPEELYERAGIYSEFGKIVCISVGFIVEQDKTLHFRLKSFYGDNEKELINNFNNLLNKSFNKEHHYLCGHNAKEFDFPYIARRSLINGLKLPQQLNIAGKKPWEVKHLDTMDLWKFGDYKHYTSLNLLTAIFDIPSPKDDIDGSEVGRVYWVEKNLERIAEYCQKDVLAVAQLFLRYKGEDLILPENVQVV